MLNSLWITFVQFDGLAGVNLELLCRISAGDDVLTEKTWNVKPSKVLTGSGKSKHALKKLYWSLIHCRIL